MTSFKVGVYGGGTGNTIDDPASSAVRFATEEEGQAYGRDLLSRWMVPEAFVVLSSMDPVNYIWDPQNGLGSITS